MDPRCWHLSWPALLLAGAALAAAQPPKAEPPARPQAPADFKLHIERFGARKAPTARAELIVREGVAYEFLAEVPEEIVIIDPGAASVSLLDLKRKVQAELSAQRLDDHLAALHRRLSDRAARQEKEGPRAGRVAAAITRGLIDPHRRESAGPDGRTVRLANATVEVDAAGAPEPDAARLAVVVNSLAALAKLGPFRDADSLPPFPFLDALRALAGARRLRPTEIKVLYRLAGPPEVFRWTYQLVPSLTEREVEAVARVSQVRRAARAVPYGLYEPMDGAEK
jgi:hypothetical protein